MQSTILLWLVLLPSFGALTSAIAARYSSNLRNLVATGVTFLVFVLSLSLYPLVARGPVSYAFPSFIGLGLSFRIDFLGYVFAVLASLVWFLATLYSGEYMRHEHAATRYYVFLLLSLGGCLGVFITADFLSLFLFFEAMTLFSYALVVHVQSKEAMAAGRNYLYMGIFGGLCLLVAIMLLHFGTGSTNIAPGLEAVSARGSLHYLTAFLFFIGFGIKAGAVPLHIWLPQAHPVAPTPASALLSGIMIKTGAYGIIRVFNLLLTPLDGHSSLWKMTEQLGFAVIWVGMLTMFTAALLALGQKHAKRVLAYSSVSQMGYILMGVGAAAYLGYEGAMGFAGLTYHILNHAFFKAGMFLMVGAVYLRTHDLNYEKLGGLWRNFPVTAISFLVAAAAISGVPGFNGFVSKTLLHHAIVEAVEHHSSTALWFAEKIFVVTGGLTFCYILRLFSTIFLGSHGRDHRAYAQETLLERAVFCIFAAFILYGGIRPVTVLERVIIPAAGGFAYDQHALKYLSRLNVWNSHDLGGIAISLGIGAILFIFLRYRQFTLGLPTWLSIEHSIYRPFLSALLRAYMYLGLLVEMIVERALTGSIVPGGFLAGRLWAFDREVLPQLGRVLMSAALYMREAVYAYFQQNISEVRSYVQQVEWVAFFTMIKIDYNPRGDNLYRKLTLMNLDLCIFIVVVMLVIIFSLRFLTLLGP